MADDTNKIQKQLRDAHIEALKMEKERIAAQRIALKNQEEINKSNREVEEATKNLQGNFKNLVKDLAKVNKDVAISAANVRTGANKTFEDIITFRKRSKLTSDLKNDPILISATQAIVEAKKKQAKEIEEDTEIFAAKNRIEKIQLEQAKKGSDRVALEEERTKLQSDIDGRVTTIKALHVKDIEEATEREKRVRDNIDTQLEKAGKAENYNKWSNGIKELSGGLIDVAGTLDTGVQKINAFKDVISGSLAPFKKGFDGVKNMAGKLSATMRGESEEKEGLGDSVKKLTSEVDENARKQKKGTSVVGKLIKNLGVFGIIIAGLAFVFMKLKDSSERLQKFLSRWGWGEDDNEKSQAQAFENLKSKYAIDMAGALDDNEKNRLTQNYRAQLEALYIKQDQRWKDLSEDERKKRLDTGMALSSTYVSHKANLASKLALKSNPANSFNEARKQALKAERNNIGQYKTKDSLTQNLRKNLNPFEKTPTANQNANAFRNSMKALKEGAKWKSMSVGQKLALWAKRGGTVASVYFTGDQILDHLNQADDMNAALEDLMFPDEGPAQIHPHQYMIMRQLIKNNKIEKIATEVTAASAALYAGGHTLNVTSKLATGATVASGGTGALPAYAAAGLASILAGGFTYLAVAGFGDYIFNSDDKLIAMLNENGEWQDFDDPEAANAKAEEIKKEIGRIRMENGIIDINGIDTSKGEFISENNWSIKHNDVFNPYPLGHPLNPHSQFAVDKNIVQSRIDPKYTTNNNISVNGTSARNESLEVQRMRWLEGLQDGAVPYK